MNHVLRLQLPAYREIFFASYAWQIWGDETIDEDSLRTHVVDFLQQNPYTPPDYETASALLRVGGYGDQAGHPYIPTNTIFLRFIKNTRELPTQDDFVNACYAEWKHTEWFKELNHNLQRGILEKARHNFYASHIDQLHACILLQKMLNDREGRNLNNAKNFNVNDFNVNDFNVIIDSYADITQNADLLVIHDGFQARIGMRVISSNTQKVIAHRGHIKADYELDIPLERPRTTGNIRWTYPEDLQQLITDIQNGKMPCVYLADARVSRW